MGKTIKLNDNFGVLFGVFFSPFSLPLKTHIKIKKGAGL